MWIEAWALKESDKKKKEISEKQKLKIEKWVSSLKELKEKEKKEEEKEKQWLEENMDEILNLVDKWIISKETAKNIVEGKDIDEDTVKEIFDKIDDIEDIKDIDDILPPELRITKEQYIKALDDDIFRVKILTKIDSSLTLLSNKITWDNISSVNLFSWFLTVLDKNLVKVQENTIDIKDCLKNIDIKKFWVKKCSKTLWREIIDFIKEVFK